MTARELPLTPAEIRRLARIHGMSCPGCSAQLAPFFHKDLDLTEADLAAWENPRVRGEFSASFCPAPHARPGVLNCPCCNMRISLVTQRRLPSPISSLWTIEDWEEHARKRWESWAGKPLSENAIAVARRARSLLEQCQ